MVKSKLTPEQKRVKKIITYLRKYINTYPKQSGYLNYSDDVIIDDILYGLGAALDEQYKYASGFYKFKKFLSQRFMWKWLNGEEHE